MMTTQDPAVTAPTFAIVTPFDRSGHVDFGALGDYLAFLAECGVRSLIVNGTTAEFPSLTDEERHEILEFVRRRFNGTLLANISSCSIRNCQTHLAHAQDHADALLLLPPYYFAAPGPEGLEDFFVTSLKRCEKPVYLYNFPRHTQAPVPAEMVARLAGRFPLLEGVKDSGGSLTHALEYKRLVPRLYILYGGDSRALEVLQEGLYGASSGAGSPLPEFLLEIAAAFHAGRMEDASNAQEAFNTWNRFRKGMEGDEVAVVKAALGARIPGFPSVTRPPLRQLDEQGIRRVRERIDTIPLPRVSQ